MIRDAIADVAVFLAKRHLFCRAEPLTGRAPAGGVPLDREAWESIFEKLAPTDGAILDSFGRNRHSLAAGDALKRRILLHCAVDPAWERKLQKLAFLFSESVGPPTPGDC